MKLASLSCLLLSCLVAVSLSKTLPETAMGGTTHQDESGEEGGPHVSSPLLVEEEEEEMESQTWFEYFTACFSTDNNNNNNNSATPSLRRRLATVYLGVFGGHSWSKEKSKPYTDFLGMNNNKDNPDDNNNNSGGSTDFVAAAAPPTTCGPNLCQNSHHHINQCSTRQFVFQKNKYGLVGTVYKNCAGWQFWYSQQPASSGACNLMRNTLGRKGGSCRCGETTAPSCGGGWVAVRGGK